MTATMKMALLRIHAKCSLVTFTDVLEVLAVSVITVQQLRRQLY
jgi:hypothetical protein